MTKLIILLHFNIKQLNIDPPTYQDFTIICVKLCTIHKYKMFSHSQSHTHTHMHTLKHHTRTHTCAHTLNLETLKLPVQRTIAGNYLSQRTIAGSWKVWTRYQTILMMTVMLMISQISMPTKYSPTDACKLHSQWSRQHWLTVTKVMKSDQVTTSPKDSATHTHT